MDHVGDVLLRQRSVMLVISLVEEKKKKKTKIFIKVQGDISEPNHLRCAKELTAPTDPRQLCLGS